MNCWIIARELDLFAYLNVIPEAAVAQLSPEEMLCVLLERALEAVAVVLPPGVVVAADGTVDGVAVDVDN